MPTRYEVRLYVVSNREVWIPKTECLTPLRADRADGIHLALEPAYCELRAHFWVWKNETFSEADYVGFFHYRRYLELVKGKGIRCPSRDKRPLPYRICRKPDEEGYTETAIKFAVSGFDAVAPVWEYTGLTVWERYEKKGHRREDLALVYQIIAEKYPEYLSAADAYLNGKGEYYGSIYVMRWPLFCNYCCWLFDILGEYDARAKSPPARVNAYLGERLFGIYFTWLQRQAGIFCGEYPRVHFSCYDDERHCMRKQRFTNFFLRPGSVWRAAVCRIVLRCFRRGP